MPMPMRYYAGPALLLTMAILTMAILTMAILTMTILTMQGRPFYRSALACIRDYVKNDLRRLDIPPAQLLSSRPMEDPLESIMYMTSVGVPSVVYETVKNLRQA